MSKQTAVEWFWNEMAEILPYTVDSETAVKLYESFQQAKIMEREQIIDAHKQGEEFALVMNMPDSKEYYNETYKGGEQ